MTTLTSQSESAIHPPLRVDGRRFYDVVAELCEVSERGLTRVEYYGHCFETVSKFLSAVVGVLNLRHGARTLERTFAINPALAANWHTTIDDLVLQVQIAEVGLTRFYRNAAGSTVAYAIAAPIQSTSGKTIGGMVFVLPPDSVQDAESQLLQLNQLLDLINENAPSAETPKTANHSGQGLNQTLQSIVRASDYRTIQHLAFAIVNSLCSKFGCEQVGIGLVRNRNVRLLAVSGLSEVPKNTPGIMAIQQAMAVCLDRNDATVVQQNGRLVGQIESAPCRLHQFWHRLAGESCVATIPLRIAGDCIAVISLRRKSNQPLMPDDLHRIRLLAESFAPALPLVDQASRSVVRHACESFRLAVAQGYSWNKMGQKLVAFAICAMLVWMVFGRMEYQILAPCKIVPEQIYTVSVPHESMISQVFVLPGQPVKAGDVLVQLDTRDLLIQQMSLKSAMKSTQIEANALLSQRLHQEAFLRQSEIEVLETDLTLVDEQIARSRIRAPHNGIVMPTKIHQRIGQFVALGEPLLEIANEEHWHLEADIPEHQAQYLAKRQFGQFQCAARPDEQLPCAVTKISPASEVLRNKNVVVAEAVLRERGSWMKLGMEGHVRIATGTKPVWWVYLHPVVDYVRLKLWL